MTTTQFFIVLGTVWVAPHAGKTYSRFVGVGFLALAMILEMLS